MKTLYLDEHLFVVDKPPGLLSQPDRTGDVDVHSLARERLEEEDAEEPFVGLVHRLDRPASGVMVLARSSEDARVLSKQFRERVTEKWYLVVVEGGLQGIGRWTDYIAKPGRQPKIVPPDEPEGKRAELSWQALATSGDRTLLQVELESGRPHQIRLQASSRGHPVVGDRRYGATTSLDGGAIALHHTLLRIEHPACSRRETFAAAPPSVWTDVSTAAMKDAIERFLAQAQVGQGRAR